MKKTVLCLSVMGLLLSACATTSKVGSQASTNAETVVETQPTEIETVKVHEPGDHLAIVCVTPVPAEGDLADRPNMHVMWENYLPWPPDVVFNHIGGKVAVNGNLPEDQGRWTNACTVRLSHMMNMADYKLSHDGNKTVTGRNGNKHYYRVADVEKRLAKEFGPPDVAVLDGTGSAYDLPNEPGIVLMDFPNSSFTGHVTIWNGTETVDKSEIGGYRVVFWKLPCFAPPDRETTSEVPVVDVTSNVTTNLSPTTLP